MNMYISIFNSLWILLLLSILPTFLIHAQNTNTADLCFDEAGNLSLCITYDNIAWSEDEEGFIIELDNDDTYTQFVVTSDFAQLFDRTGDGNIDEAQINLSDIDDLYDYLISQGFDPDGDGNLNINPDNLSEVNAAIAVFVSSFGTNVLAIIDNELPPLKVLNESGTGSTDIVAWLKGQKYYTINLINTDVPFSHDGSFHISTCTSRGTIIATINEVNIVNWNDIADNFYITNMRPVYQTLNTNCQTFSSFCYTSSNISSHTSLGTNIHFNYADIQHVNDCGGDGGKKRVITPPFAPINLSTDDVMLGFGGDNPWGTDGLDELGLEIPVVPNTYYAHGLDFVIHNKSAFQFSTPPSFAGPGTTVYSGTFLSLPLHLPVRRSKISAKTNIATNKLHIQVYPNPCHQQLHINLSLDQDLPSSCKIYNSRGEIMYQQQITDNNCHNRQLQLQVSQWPNGKYYCVVQQGTDKQVNSFIKF